MATIVWLGYEIIQAKLTFDNGLTYTARSDSQLCDGVLADISIDESDAVTSGNPIGIMSPNDCNLTIWDLHNKLIPTNTTSPYYGYMRNGVYVELSLSIDGAKTWKDYGKYYTENWSVTIESGGAQAASITCTDKLAFIGNKEIPTLSAYAGVDVIDLLKEIFSALGMATTEYSVDPSLVNKVNMLVAITKGELLRDVLNTIAQALLARITLDRSGVIQVKPALPSTTVDFGELTSTGLQSMQINHNQLSVYNRVKLIYNEVDNNRPADVIYQQNNLLLKVGANSFNNISIQENILTIDDVFFDIGADATTFIDQLGIPSYTASQRGISVSVTNKTTKDIYASLIVEGKLAGLTDSFVESVVKNTDVKVSNTLTIESYVIQDKGVAQTYVNGVADYLQSMKQEILLSGALSPTITPGVYIRINTGDVSIDGRYLVLKYSLSMGYAQFGATLTMVKVA